MRIATTLLSVAATVLLVIAPMVEAQSSRDSAGVLIVENERPAWTASERVQLAAKPRLAIGNNTESAIRFRRIAGALLLTDGRIAVVDATAEQLRIFDHQGRILSSTGGLTKVSARNAVHRLRGDTIAIKTGVASLQLYTGDGQFARTVQLPAGGEAQARQRPLLYAMFTSELGVAGLENGSPPREVGTRFVLSINMRLVTSSDTSGREIGVFPHLVLEETRTGLTSVQLSPTGVFAATEDRFYSGFGDRYEIRAFGRDGKLQSIIRRSWTPVPITSADWEQWVAARMNREMGPPGAALDARMKHVQGFPRAAELPAYSQLIIDRTGRLWMRESHLQDAAGSPYLSGTPVVPSTWSVFDVRGRWLGDVNMPIGFDPSEIGADYVIGSLRTNGLVQLVIYDLGVRGR